MNATERTRLSNEAKMQMAALKKINCWKVMALAISAVGVALAYAGLAGAERNLLLGIPGIAVIITGAACAVVLNLGLKNGRRNVEKMLDVLEASGK